MSALVIPRLTRGFGLCNRLRNLAPIESAQKKEAIMDVDLSGIDDLVGARLEELGIDPDLVGARRGRGRGTAQADRRYILGLGSSTLGGAGATTLTGTPNLKFRPDRIVLVDSLANNSLITSIKAGNVDQVIGGSFPLALLQATAIGTSMRGQTVDANTQIVVAATLAAAGTISGGIVGLADQ